MKESKPAIASADVELIRKVIAYYLKYASPPNKEVEEKLLSLHHRVGRLDSWFNKIVPLALYFYSINEAGVPSKYLWYTLLSYRTKR